MNIYHRQMFPVAYDGEGAAAVAMTGVNYGATSPIPTVATVVDPLAYLDKPSADHKAMSPYWDKVAAVLGGIDTLRAAGKTYLPKFPNEETKDYEYRLASARLTNVFRDIVETLSQKPFTEKLKIVEDGAPEEIVILADDIDGRGNNLHVFAAETFFEGIANAIDWVLIEFPDIDNAASGNRVRTKADDKAEKVRPYWVHIPAANVLEARAVVQNGEEYLTYVRVFYPGSDVDRVRVMERNGAGCTFAVYEKTKELGAKWQLVKTGVITIGEIPMVPFLTGRRMGSGYRVSPPLRDAADLQIEVYQSESGLKHVKTMTAYPMLAANGIMPDKNADGTPKPVPMGPNVVLYGPPDGEGGQGKWERLSADAPAMVFLASDVERDIQQLRELGRQPLTAQSGGVTRISAAMAASKGNSSAQTWALALKDALELALYYTQLWLDIVPNEEKPVEVQIHTDFEVESDDDKSPEYLTKMRENGDLSQPTYWREMQRRGILSSSFDPETEKEDIAGEMPTGDEEFGNVAIDPKTGLPVPKKPASKPPVAKPPTPPTPVA